MDCAVKFVSRRHKFQFQIFWTECRNFRDYFWIVQANFRDCVLIVRVEFSGLFSNNPEKIFGIVFMQSQTMLRFVFYPGTDVFGFVMCFGITIIR